MASPGRTSVRQSAAARGWAGVEGSGWGQARVVMTAAHRVMKYPKKCEPSTSFMSLDLMILTLSLAP